MPKKPRAICVGSTPTTPITSKERKEIVKQINKGREELRKVYPEVRGKVVDFISHTVTDGTLYVSVRFTDDTNFSIRYASNMFVVGVDLTDWKTGGHEHDLRVHEADSKVSLYRRPRCGPGPLRAECQREVTWSKARS
jgi:hypothetical protein